MSIDNQRLMANLSAGTNRFVAFVSGYTDEEQQSRIDLVKAVLECNSTKLDNLRQVLA